MFRQKDLELLRSKGIAVAQAEAQMKRFATGFPYMPIVGAATPGHGITVLGGDGERAAIERWQRYLSEGGDVYKFVPASGAASRMFKALFEFVNGDTDEAPESTPVGQLMANLDELPFIEDLREAVLRIYGSTLDELVAAGRTRDIIAAIVNPEGMNYGQLPKALLRFHAYEGEPSRTPLDEQLTEGAQTAANAAGEVKLHFTVSANHRRLFEEKLAEAVPAAEARTGRKFTVTLSEQKPSTDTIAANIDNDEPFLENDSLFFRPGGHGALIENLNDIDAAVVFIKNIDNVVPDRHRDATVRYKQVIGGYMMLLHDAIARFIAAIDAGEDVTAEAIEFMRHSLSTDDKRFDTLKGTDLVRLVRSKLDRPLRVCGMVRNEGEPGGGPYITVNPDGSSSLQILESTQIGPDYKDMMAGATHFNPVDLVCYIKNPAGVKYDLTRYVDPATGFISQKSSHGRELRAMELPGLWNGAMSDWNTAFVEVPVETFNPVKTVNDLLRPAHRK